MGQKLSSKLLFIYSPNSDGFYIFHISQGSVATQLRCGGMFGNHFITNFPQNAPVKNFKNRSIFHRDIWTQLCGLLFWGHPVYSLILGVITWHILILVYIYFLIFCSAFIIYIIMMIIIIKTLNISIVIPAYKTQQNEREVGVNC